MKLTSTIQIFEPFSGGVETQGPILGPYRIAAAEIFHSGRVSSEVFHTGAASAETFHTGAVARQIHG